MAHTKGPWVLRENKRRRVFLVESIAKFVREDGEPADHTTIVSDDFCADFEMGRQRDDMLLIAAAPDMLEALKAILAYEDDIPAKGSFGYGVYAKARAAISKAESK